MVYVTFNIRPTAYCKSLGYCNKYYAIKCDNMTNAKEAASDINSIDGISYIRINKSGRIRKDAKVILYGSDYISCL